jgi:hypothetical protein
MRKTLASLVCLCLTSSAVAGFKVKLVKPKKPDKFQTRMAAGRVTFAADLVAAANDQRGYFYKELTPSHVVAVRLAVFNEEQKEVVLPLDRLQLLDPSGTELVPVAPATVAQAVLKGLVVTAKPQDKAPVEVAPRLDPRLDPNDPRNNPNDPRYDPRAGDPRRDPRINDPRYDPNDPRYGRYPGSGYPPYVRSGVDVVLNPGALGGGGDLSRFEQELVEKDFDDKAHTLEPVRPSSVRDKFLYFSFKDLPASTKGFVLRFPAGSGSSQEVVLKF